MAELLASLRAALADRYTIERELGRGGMATVYLAQDLKHHRRVAIKVLRPELAAALGPERFLREIAIASSLQHPHMLTLIDSGSDGGFLYYVMPYVEGESLRGRLEREKQLPVEDAIQIAREVADALSYAHSRGVLHRDIKPENILLSGGHAIVADFGIARAISVAGEGRLTQTGVSLGTPAYMSPEQATGSGQVDGRSDIYSLGCVLYELLAGDPPFAGTTAQAIIARHLVDRPPRLRTVRQTVAPAVERALERALAKVPADRFATAAQFAEALKTSSTITAPKHRLLGAFVAMRERWGLRAAVIIITLVAGTWATRKLWFGSAGPSTDSQAPRPDPRHVAVLYFDATKELQHQADTLTEGLILALSTAKALLVIPQEGVLPFRNTSPSLDTIARTLKVGTLVEGTVSGSANQLHVNIVVLNVATGTEVGSTTVSGPRGNLSRLEDTLVRTVSVMLGQGVGGDIQVQLGHAGAGTIEALRLVVQADRMRREVDTLLAAGDTSKAARQLVETDSLLARASTTDPEWIRPIIDRGWVAWEQRRILGFEKVPAARWTARGLDFAGQALRLSPEDPEALHLRGTMRYVRWLLSLEPDSVAANELLAGAEQDLRAGTAASNPRRASALALLSHLLARENKASDSRFTAMQAYELDPNLPDADNLLMRIFVTSLDLEDAPASSKWCQEGNRRFPKEPAFTECQIEVMALKGQKPDIDEAWRLLEQDVRMYPPGARDYRRRRGHLFIAIALVRAGLPDSARHVALRSRADSAVDPSRDLVYVEVLLRSILGDRDEALRLVREYLEKSPQDKTTIANDSTWWWRGLRDDPRFKQLVGIR